MVDSARPQNGSQTDCSLTEQSELPKESPAESREFAGFVANSGIVARAFPTRIRQIERNTQRADCHRMHFPASMPVLRLNSPALTAMPCRSRCVLLALKRR